VIPRHALETIVRLAGDYRVVSVTGPRQSGKTTLARTAFPDKPYVNLEAPDERAFALRDPRGFLARFPDGAVLDEAQYAPDLFSYIQVLVDEDQRPGRYILTGSQNFLMLEKISQSLAGRTGILNLLPLAYRELADAGRSPMKVDELLHRGFYPRLHVARMDSSDWYGTYVTTFLERDVRRIVAVQDLDLFQRFLGLCAARTAQLLNIDSLASDCGIAHGTARGWLSVLEASYIVFRLQPHFENLGKRLIKSPKLYFCDVGLAAFLVGIQDAAHMAIHSARAALFETFVMTEFLKTRFNQAQRSNLFFWRDNIGTEVDVVVEDRGGLFPIEIKSGQTFREDFLKNVHRFQKYAGSRASGAGLVYGGDQSYVRSGVTVKSWRDL